MKGLFVLFLGLLTLNCIGQTTRRRGDVISKSKQDTLLTNEGIKFLKPSQMSK